MNGGAPTRQEQSLLARYDALVRLSRAIHVHRDPKELFRVLAGALRQVVEFDFIGLFLYDETTNTLANPVLESDYIPDFAIPTTLPAEETMTWWVYHNQQPVVIGSRDEETRFPKMMELFTKYRIDSACVLPLTTAHRRLGGLGFAARHQNAYSTEEVRFLTLVAEQVALAVDNAIRNDEQERMREELRKRKAHLEKLFELAPEPIVLRG